MREQVRGIATGIADESPGSPSGGSGRSPRKWGLDLEATADRVDDSILGHHTAFYDARPDLVEDIETERRLFERIWARGVAPAGVFRAVAGRWMAHPCRLPIVSSGTAEDFYTLT